jgi:hypothetical protein
MYKMTVANPRHHDRDMEPRIEMCAEVARTAGVKIQKGSERNVHLEWLLE